MTDLFAYLSKRKNLIFPGAIVLWALCTVIVLNLSVTLPYGNQFGYLAKAFAAGQLHFLEMPGHWGDTTVHDGLHFWPLGPVPAVLLLPLALVSTDVLLRLGQQVLSIIAGSATFALVYLLAKKNGYNTADALFAVFAFCFGSAFLAVALLPMSWYLAQTVTVALLAGAIVEHTRRDRPWLIGVLMAMAAATRVTAGIGIVFFIWRVLASDVPRQEKIKRLVILLTPLLIVGLLLAGYNFARFGNALDQGYRAQVLLEGLISARDYGLFSLTHLPGNLYYLLLAMPQPVFRDNLSHVLQFPFLMGDPWGMSIFVTSPYLLALLFLSHRDRLSRQLLYTCALIALPIVLYYGIGYYQFGYRYALDFFPFLFWLFLKNYRAQRGDLSGKIKLVIVLSGFFNFCLLFTLFLTPWAEAHRLPL